MIAIMGMVTTIALLPNPKNNVAIKIEGKTATFIILDLFLENFFQRTKVRVAAK